MKTNEYLKLRRQKLGLTMKSLADKVGVSETTISRWESGKIANMRRNVLLELAKALEVNPIDLMDPMDYNGTPLVRGLIIEDEINRIPQSVPLKIKNTVTINVLGSIAAGIPLAAQEDIIGTEEIPFEMAKSGEFFGLRVVGESMAPTIHSGDTVIIKKQSSVEDGEIGVILIDGEDATLKRIHKSNDGLLLTGDNPAVYPPTFYSDRQVENLPVTILGKAVEIRRKL